MKRSAHRNRMRLLLSATGMLLDCRVSARGMISIATVPVGNAGNWPDPDTGNTYGAVPYAYNIGEYDVTSSQYTAFLNAVAATDPQGLYNSAMSGTNSGNPGIIQSGSAGGYSYSVAAGRGNYPVTDVTFYDAARFANWMDNGQPTGSEGTGTTETGSYTLNGMTSGYVGRNSNAVWAITSENEFYKAAYYSTSKDGGGPGYYLFATGDVMTTSMANFDNADSTPVGSYPYASPYGTYDQSGDVYEWTELVPAGYSDIRGGAFNRGGDYGNENKTEPLTFAPYNLNNNIGFRLTEIGTVSQSSSGTLSPMDLSNTTTLLHAPPGGMPAVFAMLQTGYNGGNWNGSSGFYSSTAAADSRHLTAIGTMINDSGANTGANSGYVFTTVWGNSYTTDDDILLRYTYYGDANLDGKVDGSDYSLIDDGALRHLTGWYNGDFNYDGVINGSDYTLIDNAFNSQGASLADEIATTTQEFAPEPAVSPVPEPAMGAVVIVSLAGLLRRRKGYQRATALRDRLVGLSSV